MADEDRAIVLLRAAKEMLEKSRSIRGWTCSLR